MELNYRYGYQGQENDKETGWDAFELRMWDGRIGRWMSVDPYGQFHSPYVGMGNNPMNGTDPDAGFFSDPPSTPGMFDGQLYFDETNGQTYSWFEGYGWQNTLPEVILTGIQSTNLIYQSNWISDAAIYYNIGMTHHTFGGYDVYMVGKNWGGVTLPGIGSFVGHDASRDLVKHEVGHQLRTKTTKIQ